MGSCLKVTACHYLSGFAQLEGQHFLRNGYLGSICKSVLGKETSIFHRETDLLPSLIGKDGGSEGSKRAMVIMPSAPIILSSSLILEREIVQHSPNVRLPMLDSIVEMPVRIAL